MVLRQAHKWGIVRTCQFSKVYAPGLGLRIFKLRRKIYAFGVSVCEVLG